MSADQDVQSYAATALLWWADGRYPHGATICRCLMCADGRASLGLPALTPQLARALVRIDGPALWTPEPEAFDDAAMGAGREGN